MILCAAMSAHHLAHAAAESALTYKIIPCVFGTKTGYDLDVSDEITGCDQRESLINQLKKMQAAVHTMAGYDPEKLHVTTYEYKKEVPRHDLGFTRHRGTHDPVFEDHTAHVFIHGISKAQAANLIFGPTTGGRPAIPCSETEPRPSDLFDIFIEQLNDDELDEPEFSMIPKPLISVLDIVTKNAANNFVVECTSYTRPGNTQEVEEYHESKGRFTSIGKINLTPMCFIFNKAGREAAEPLLKQSNICQMLSRGLIDKFKSELAKVAELNHVPIIAAIVVLEKSTSTSSSSTEGASE